MTDYVALVNRIRRKRQEKGMTQQKLAKLINLSPSFYGHIERGTRVPSVDTLVLIANTLDTGIDILLRDSLTTPVRVERNPLFSAKELHLLRTLLDEQQNALDHWLESSDDNQLSVEE